MNRAAVITRFSNLERHCIVGDASVVDDSSVLAHTRIGKGLDVCSALVDGVEMYDLVRDVALQVRDPYLIGAAIPALPDRPVSSEDFNPLQNPAQQPEIEYSYLSRAAGRLLEVFKGEV